MTRDITHYDEKQPIADESAPPLCLVHYFAERAAYPPEKPAKPPGRRVIGRVAERSGNLIILEFAEMPEPKKTRGSRPKNYASRVYDGLLLLLLLACLLACLAAFRF